MAFEPDFSVFDSDMDIDSLQFIPPHQRATDLCQQVQELKDDVKQLRDVLHNTLSLQQKMLNHLDKVNSCESSGPPAQQSLAAPVATSTPYAPPVNISARHSNDTCPYPETQRDLHSSFLQTHSAELTNTSRVIAAALHHSKLEPPVFAGDGEVQAEDWLQAVSAYKSTLNLTDVQILNELPHFLTKEPSKWFKALRSHISSWVHFCQLFRTVFLPTDNQESILRGILDRVQSVDEPLLTFVAHMLSEFNKLSSPPPEKECIQLICKHSLEKYRVALYGSPVSSVMELLLRAHELHAVLGPDSHQNLQKRHWKQQRAEPRCYKCSSPGYTSKTCPACNQGHSQQHMSARFHNEISPTTSFDTPGAETDNGNSSPPVDEAPQRPLGNFKGGRIFRRGNPPSRR
ncbi:uncharacterized protein LOC114145504 isoform X1 [Xiphophorus couchianus]|uniref:uncharacterized protein LOC114145504 isoform X1 n=1 Tax=Xiphophorus couchianus TaxID=32473 RepID=UPI0010163E47|nr:uncharacterized protein LOC114145504 isoform X1 [Xiphophorus couchianus]